MDNEQHSYWAKKLLKALVSRVKSFNGGDKFITYGMIAKQVGYPEPHTGNLFGKNIGDTLGYMGHLFDHMLIEGKRPPLIQSMCVSSTNKLPGDGLKEFNITYPSLSKEKKRDFAFAEYRKIFEYGDSWLEVLKQLSINIPEEIDQKTKNTKELFNPYGSEGSPEHRALRDYIAKNPNAIGLDYDIKGITEYPLKSGDSIDVVFETSASITAVEVKSERSGNDDIERGIFQCIKYSAVLRAEQSIKKEEKNISVILVLASQLSNSNRKKARYLSIAAHENVKYA